MRIAKYILAWCAINVPLSILWAVLGLDPSLAFLLGMLHGGASQVWLLRKFTRVW